MFQTKVVGKVKTHFIFSHFCSTVVIYKIMWENSIEPDRPQMTIWRMSTACSISSATNTLSEHVIITATIYKDSRMTLDSLKNSKIHRFLIEEIRRKLTEMGKINWKMQLCWVRGHVGFQGNS